MCIHDCLHSFPLAIECLHSFPLAIECLHSFPLTNRCCLGNTVSHGIYLFCITVELLTTLLRPVPKIYSAQWSFHTEATVKWKPSTFPIQFQSNNVCLFGLQRVIKASFITAQPSFYHYTNVVYHCPIGQ